MLYWKSACSSDQKRLDAIKTLYRKHPDLLFYLFEPSQPRLRLPSEVLKKYAQAFSSGEKLLIRMGLDIWDGSGDALFREIYHVLDPINFKNTLETLGFLKNQSNQNL